MGGGSENFEKHDRKTPDCIEHTVVKNMVKGSAGEGLEKSKEHSRQNLYHLKEYKNHHKHTVDRNMNTKSVLVKA